MNVISYFWSEDCLCSNVRSLSLVRNLIIKSHERLTPAQTQTRMYLCIHFIGELIERIGILLPARILPIFTFYVYCYFQLIIRTTFTICHIQRALSRVHVCGLQFPVQLISTDLIMRLKPGAVRTVHETFNRSILVVRSLHIFISS